MVGEGRSGETGKLSVEFTRRETGKGFHANSEVLLEVEDKEGKGGKEKWWRCEAPSRGICQRSLEFCCQTILCLRHNNRL